MTHCCAVVVLAATTLSATPDTFTELTNLVAVLAWPVAVIAILGVIAATQSGRSLVGALVGRVSKVSAFGVDVELTPQAAIEAKATIEGTFAEYGAKVRIEFNRQVAIHSVDALHRSLVKDFIWDSLSEEVRKDFRCTVHVPDVLFAEAVYQLLDYFPRGAGSGRTFSDRFGIVGACARAEADLYRPNIPTDPARLIVDWGMTSQEATAAGQERQSFACFVIRRDAYSPLLGILYMDTKIPNAFGPTENVPLIRHSVEQGLTQTHLAGALDEVGRTMRERGPALKLFTSR